MQQRSKNVSFLQICFIGFIQSTGFVTTHSTAFNTWNQNASMILEAPSVCLAVMHSHSHRKDCTLTAASYSCRTYLFLQQVRTMFESGRKDKRWTSCSAIGYNGHLYLLRVTCALGNACFWHGDEPDFCSSITPLQNPRQSYGVYPTLLCVHPTATRLQHELQTG